MDYLLQYSYPGNVRELKNIVDRLVVLSDNGQIKADSLVNLISINDHDELGGIFDSNYSLRDIRREVESKYIESILKKNLYNITKSAKDLDISTRHLFNKILEYGIKDHADKGAVKDEE
jgi:DNA-binding NtrC family response regulator